jgi:hypothetical protein
MEKIDFASLYQFDEIYFINELMKSEQSEESEQSVLSEQSEQVAVSETAETKEINGVQTEWLIIGEEADRKSVMAIFTSAPFNFPEEKFTFQPAEGWRIEKMREFVKKATSSKMVFLGQAFEFLKLKEEPIERANRFYYYFSKTLHSLGDSDKQIKIQFWNNLKKML